MTILASILFLTGLLLAGADTIDPRAPYTWAQFMVNASGVALYVISMRILASGQKKGR